jgi:hypothetical protein
MMLKSERSRVFGLALLCIASAGLASAQSLDMQEVREHGGLNQPFVNDGPLNTVTVKGNTRIEIVGGTAAQEATLSYGEIKDQRWRVLLTTPLDKESGEGSFADLDGLTNSTRLTWEGKRYQVFTNHNEGNILKPKCAQLRAAVYAISAPSNETWNDFKKTLAKDEALCLTDFFDDAAGLAEKLPTASGVPLKNIQALREQVYSELLEDTWIGITSLRLAGGIRKIDYVNVGADSISQSDSQDDVWSAEIAQSWFKPELALLSIGARYERTVKPQKTGTVCPASSGTAPVTCTSGSIGSPKREENEVVYSEAKWSPFAGKLGVAIAPRLSYEIEDSDFGFDLPIYLIQSKKKDDGDRDFVGGVRLGWSGEENEFTAGVFVGKSFELNDQN